MPQIRTEACDGCGSCVPLCPRGALSLHLGKVHLDESRCRECGRCVEACPRGALLAMASPRLPAVVSVPSCQPEGHTGTSIPTTMLGSVPPEPGEGERATGLSSLSRLVEKVAPVAADLAISLADRWLSGQSVRSRREASRSKGDVGAIIDSHGRRGTRRRRRHRHSQVQ